MQQIVADKANIMECDPESTSVTIIFFSPKSHSVHYHTLTMELSLKKSVAGSVHIKLSTKVFKKIS